MCIIIYNTVFSYAEPKCHKILILGRFRVRKNEAVFALNLPKRKKIRLQGYDYSSNGVYFVTLCSKNRENIFWCGYPCMGNPCSPEPPALSETGQTVERAIAKLSTVYSGVWVERYRIMSDHIHMLIVISPQTFEQKMPDIPRIIKQFKGSVTKQLGVSIWQKSYFDEIIRNDEHLARVWNYTEYNYLKPHGKE